MKKINKLIKNIDSIKKNIEQNKAKIIGLKDKNKQNKLDMGDTKKEILSVLEKIGLDILKDNELINYLYWDYKFSLKELSNAIGVQNKTLNIKPMTKTMYCKYCELEYEVEKNFRHGPTKCPGCIKKEIDMKEYWKGRDRQHTIKEENRRLRREELHIMPYYEYLQTPEWKQRSYDTMKKAKFKCQLCGISGKKLNTHHNTYERRGYEMSSDLMVLCEKCHETYSKK